MKRIIEVGLLVLQAQKDQGDPIVLDGRARALLLEAVKRLESQEDAERILGAVNHQAALASHEWFEHRHDCGVCLLGRDCQKEAQLQAKTHVWFDRMRAIRGELGRA